MPTCSPLFSREKKWRHKDLSGLHPPGVEAGSILTVGPRRIANEAAKTIKYQPDNITFSVAKQGR
jgi:hypothetical protein